ncbi:MAG: hypothetical protein ACLPTF_21785 [Steroidobacteraceae bacterium]
MMKLAPLLRALCVCAPLALGASAAELPARNGAAVAVANTGQAVGGDAPGRDASINAGRPVAQESTHVDSGKGDGSKGRHAAAVSPRRSSATPLRAAGPLARSNADRLRSLHPAKARGRITPTANRRVGPNPAAASGNLSARGRGLPGASPQGVPAPPVATSAARAPPNVKAMVRGSTIGGPRAVGPGRVGGPATGRAANNTAIDGTQVRRKF